MFLIIITQHHFTEKRQIKESDIKRPLGLSIQTISRPGLLHMKPPLECFHFSLRIEIYGSDYSRSLQSSLTFVYSTPNMHPGPVLSPVPVITKNQLAGLESSDPSWLLSLGKLASLGPGWRGLVGANVQNPDEGPRTLGRPSQVWAEGC